jgi:hypothetical protein
MDNPETSTSTTLGTRHSTKIKTKHDPDNEGPYVKVKYIHIILGISKTCNGTKRNEIETKRNETKRNEILGYTQLYLKIPTPVYQPRG